jgi:hypothetical protein
MKKKWRIAASWEFTTDEATRKFGYAMKFLTGPYGYGNGDAVSITSFGDVSTPKLVEILEQHSCYPPAIPKIIACLEGSGRYDCVLQPNWFRKQAVQLSSELRKIGVYIKVTSLSERDPGLKSYVADTWETEGLL